MRSVIAGGLLIAALSGCTLPGDRCEHPPPPTAPTTSASTLADSYDRLTAEVYLDPAKGVRLTLSPLENPVSCPILSATATLNGLPMTASGVEQPPTRFAGTCNDQCCTNDSYYCNGTSFTYPTLPTNAVDIVVSDASGAGEIKFVLNGNFPSFSLQGSNVLEAGETVSLAVSPPGTVVQAAYVSSPTVVFSRMELAQTSTGVSFVVPPLDEVVDASAPIAACGDPTKGPITVPCSAGLTVQFVSTAVPTIQLTKCAFENCVGYVDNLVSSTPVVISNTYADPVDAGVAPLDGG